MDSFVVLRVSEVEGSCNEKLVFLKMATRCKAGPDKFYPYLRGSRLKDMDSCLSSLPP